MSLYGLAGKAFACSCRTSVCVCVCVIAEWAKHGTVFPGVVVALARAPMSDNKVALPVAWRLNQVVPPGI